MGSGISIAEAGLGAYSDVLRRRASSRAISSRRISCRKATVETHENLGLTQKSIAVDNILAQSGQQEAEALYLRSAGKGALLSGYISAGAGLLGAVGQSLSATPGGPGMANIGSQSAAAAEF